jgi:hypothetical protein
MGDAVPADWTPRLAAAVAEAVREFAPLLGGAPVALLALDCHPWHGSLDLSALTAADVAADPALADPTEMAAWQRYRFSDGLAAWVPVAALGREMRAGYEAAPDHAAVAEAFMRACAGALARPEVLAAVELLERVAGFRLTVTHPDDGREFVAGSAPDAEPGAAADRGGTIAFPDV